MVLIYGQEAASSVIDNSVSPIDYWRTEGHWPKEFFTQDEQARKDFYGDFEEASSHQTYLEPETNMNHLLARRKSSSSVRGRPLEARATAPSSSTPSDQKPREAKSFHYARPSHETALAAKGSFMCKSDLGMMQARNCVELYLRPNNQSLNTPYFVTICSKKPATVCEREMKLWLFETFPR